MKIRNISSPITVAVALMATLLGSCLKNDIPYPRIQPNITEVTAEGQVGEAKIDSVTRTATITLDESVDITRVQILKLDITPGAELLTDINLDTPIDMSDPLHLTLALYQDYEWTVQASQTIERYFTVSNQIGESVIDVPGRRIIVTLPNTVDTKAIKVLSAKLGPEGYTCEPALAKGMTIDLSRPFETEVTVHGRSELWTIYAELTDATVVTSSVDAWTCVAWAYANVLDSATGGFEYRKEGAEEWTKVADSEITRGSGTMLARICHLSALTNYEVRAYNDSETANILSFTTGAQTQMPNSDFSQWWLDGKVWCPWAQDDEPYWDTGNKGATSLGDGNVSPSTDTPTGSGYSAQLQTQWKLVKLAAGSIFTGTFVDTDGTHGILSFGQPFSERPTKLRGWYKYTSKAINKTSPDDSSFNDKIGQPDTGIIWIALIDSPIPFEIRTRPSVRQLFDPDGPEVIAYGKLEKSETVSQWTKFDIELNYVSTSRVPTYIITVASSSIYGDYFVGGVGSTLWVDDFELGYDY